MNPQCSIARLESALAGNLPADDEAALHRHLEVCEACGAALERMAGGPAWCQEAASLLTGDELDAAVPTRDEWSEVDFTVEHLEPSDEPNVLGRLGGYDVLEIIGHGGMGVVLKGFDRELKRCVAIKVLAPHLARSSLAKKRFAREAQAAAAVVHPHVLAIHQVQPNGRLPFLVMPLVAGESLAERLTAQGSLELKETLRIGMQAAAGLAAAHEQGLVHRDVKPANILLEKGVERAVLTDFGLARAADDVTLTRWGIVARTPQYMSPEQARGEPLDGRSDLFSLGCVLYEMATGVSPFRTDSMMATMRRLVDDSPQAMGSLNPELPPWFIAIVNRLLEKDPSRRFGSAKEVSELLEGCLAHVQQPAAVPLPASLVRRTADRSGIFNSHRKGIIAMLGVFSSILLGAVVWQALDVPPGANNGSTTAKLPAESQPKTKTAIRTRLNYFTTGHSMKIACSADGKLIAVANGNPTCILLEGGTSRVKGNWKPTADILDVDTGKIVVSLMLTTHDEDAVLAATERISHIEATALAFSPAGNVVAVGTSVGQVKLFNARTGELVRALDDEPAKLADKKAPENWKSLRRAMGSVGSLAFSPDGSLLAMCGAPFGNFSFDGVTRLTREVTGPGRLKVWDVKAGTLKHDLVGHNHAEAVAFSPDGNLLASAGRWSSESDNGAGVIIWNPRTGAKIRTMTNEANGGTHAVAFSPDSKLIVIDSEDTGTTTVRLAHVGTGNVEWQQSMPGHAYPKAFSPDGKSVLVLYGQSIRFLDTETGTVKREIKSTDLSRDGRWDDVALPPQGPRLAIAAVDDEEGNVEVWDFNGLGAAANSAPAEAAPRRVHQFPTGASVKAIACSADGKRIAIASGDPKFPVGDGWKQTAEILDAETGKSLVSLTLTTDEETAVLAATQGLPQFEVEALAFSPDGNLVAVGTGIGQVKLFNARSGELVRSLDDDEAKLAEKRTPEKLKILKRAGGSVASLAFSPDGSLLATCGESFDDVARDWGGKLREDFTSTGPGRLKVWDVKTGLLKHDLVGHDRHAEAVCFSPDGNLLASAGRWAHGTGVIIWNPQTGAKIGTIPKKASGGTHAVAFSPDSKLVVIRSQHFDKDNDTSTGELSLTHVESGLVEWRQTVSGWGQPVGFSPDGTSVAVLCDGQAIRFFDTETGTMKHEIRSPDFLPAAPRQDGQWNAFAITPHGHTLSVGGVDKERKGSVEVWDFDGSAAAMPQPARHFQTGDQIKIIACSTDGKLIAIANGNPTFPLKDDWKRVVEILDAETGKTVVSLKLTTDDEETVLDATEGIRHFEVEALAFSPDGNVVAVGTGLGQVKLFEARTGKVVRSLDDEQAKLAEMKTPEVLKLLARAMGGVASLAFSPDGSLLAMGGSSFDDVARNWGGVRQLGRLGTGPGRLKVWDVKTGTLKQDLVGHSHADVVAFSPDGNLLASAGSWASDRENGTGVIIWNPHTGAKMRTFPKKANGGTHAVAFSPNSKLLVIGSRIFDKDDDTSTTAVSLIRAGTGILEWQQSIPGWAIPKAFSPDGKSVAVLCGGQSIWFIETETGKVQHEIRSTDSPQGGLWNDFALPPQAGRLVIGGNDAEKRGFITVRDLDGASADAR